MLMLLSKEFDVESLVQVKNLTTCFINKHCTLFFFFMDFFFQVSKFKSSDYLFFLFILFTEPSMNANRHREIVLFFFLLSLQT